MNYMISCIKEKNVSCVDDKDKFFQLLNILEYELSDEIKNKIIALQ